MRWNSSEGHVSLIITREQAGRGHHQGACDGSIAELRTHPAIKAQLDRLNAEAVKGALKPYGAWNEEELENHDANLSRILWLACADIVEGN